MNRYKALLGSILLLAASGCGVAAVQAQNDDEVISERQTAFAERQVERAARRAKQWSEFSEENPELAAEILALRAEREAEREQQRAEFAAKYPNLAAIMEEGRFPRQALRGSVGSRFDRSRQGPPRGDRSGRSEPGR